MTSPFFTIGHSTHRLQEFAALLEEAGVERVVDIRKIPGSRKFPQFNEDALTRELPVFGIHYEHVAALGGLRGKSHEVAATTNAWWDNDSFHRYADYACTPAFAEGFAYLLDIGRRECCALMCSEVLWWRCHRRIVADHLLARGETVWHIMGLGKIEAAHLSAGAVVGEGGAVTYPATIAS